MPSSTNRELTGRFDAIERKLAALQAHELALSEAITCAFGYAGVPTPPGLRDEYRPVLSVIQGGRR